MNRENARSTGAVLFKNPRGGVLSWGIFGLAILYAIIALVTIELTMVLGIPIVLLASTAEILPEDWIRAAGMLRLTTLGYMLVVAPSIYLVFS